MDFNESLEDCAAREVVEETGLVVEPSFLRFLTCTNDIMADEGKHYVTVFMGCVTNGPCPKPKVGFFFFGTDN